MANERILDPGEKQQADALKTNQCKEEYTKKDERRK